MTADLQRFKEILAIVARGEALDFATAREAFSIMMSGDATPAQMGAFLMGLRVRGETIEEIAAGATVLRERMVRVNAPPGAIDTCGTGGDGAGTYNISTAAALVVAACGVPVAKHGNRGLSSRSGSSDVLQALGVDIDAPVPVIEEAMRVAGIGFMMAPRHHGAMRHVAGPRTELATRTIFNLLGPLANPAGVKRQLVGVFARQWVEPIAMVLGRLGAERAWVVHGSDGLDELTTTGPSWVAEWDGTTVRTFEVVPEMAGLPRARPEDLKGGDAAHNAEAIRAVLAGVRGPFRDAVVFAAAAALVVAGRSSELARAAELASEAIDSGRAERVLEQLVQITNRAKEHT
ncbi:MAG: anthranilate phosphoribosyltransferase [Geminicoccaceae bacterium]|nr:anthranilate phosphoribosyltransferase [Geminicoccaceae bacterium]MCS7266839.1 anthranilate phosphoribosyltransferase [Geminicoccaceae bacterium]MCX7630919.1 anthranilate phosphoribosyltransferase [Geminicoccaceae bacterium]